QPEQQQQHAAARSLRCARTRATTIGPGSGTLARAGLARVAVTGVRATATAIRIATAGAIPVAIARPRRRLRRHPVGTGIGRGDIARHTVQIDARKLPGRDAKLDGHRALEQVIVATRRIDEAQRIDTDTRDVAPLVPVDIATR